MTYSENQSPKIKLIIEADPATETFILDPNYQLITRGVGHFTTDQSPGFYNIKFRTGTSTAVISKSLDLASAEVTIQAPRLRFASPTLFWNTTKTHEYHVDNASRVSTQLNEKTIVLGSGSQLFLCARAWTDLASRGSLQGLNPSAGLTLHDMQGLLLVDFTIAGERQLSGNFPGFDPWAACNIIINPGSYRLRLQTSDWGTLEQIIVTCRDWQTQIFLLLTACGVVGQLPSFRADLSNASVLLSRIGEGFDASNSELELVEIARIALTNCRNTLARSLLDRLLNGKSSNPMLGIYGAHVLLVSPKPDWVLLRKVVDELLRLLGSHPDVEALALALEDRKYPYPVRYDSPPMLRSSWSSIVKCSIEKPDLIPYNSLSARIANYTWGDGVWLIWLADKLDEAMTPLETTISIDEQLSQISQITEKLELDRVGFPKALVQGDLGLSCVETELLSYAIRRTRACAPKEPPKGLEEVVRSSDPTMKILSQQNEFAQALGLPPATVQATVGHLLRKLRANDGSLPPESIKNPPDYTWQKK